MTTTRSHPHPRPRGNARRLGALGAVAAIALVTGVITGARHEPDERRLATEWARAWSAGDYGAMHAMLTPEARRAMPLQRFAQAYRDAAATATLSRLRTGKPRVDGDTAVVPV